MSPRQAITQIFSGINWAETRLKALRADPPERGLLILRDPAAPAAVAYSERLLAYAGKAGIRATARAYPDSQLGLDAILCDASDAVLPMYPLPDWCNPQDMMVGVGPARDVEGLHPMHAGALALGQPGRIPPTARAAYDITRHLAGSQTGSLRGKRVALVGASPVVGRPLALLLLQSGATLRIAQKETVDLAAETKDAEIVISAAGVPGLLKRCHVAKGAICVDVGVTRVQGEIVGDFDAQEMSGHAGWITHVPDGVGPLTCACLLENLKIG